MTRGVIASVALALAITGPARAQEHLVPGVYVQEISVRLPSGETARGAGHLVEPRDLIGTPGSGGQPVSVVLDIGPGELQRALARYHQDQIAHEAYLRTRDAAGRLVTIELRDMYVSSYSPGRAGSARVVLQSRQGPEQASRSGVAEVSGMTVEHGVIEATTTHRLELARPGHDPYVLEVEIPRQTVRSGRIQVLLRPARGQPVRAIGILRTATADGRATPGDVLVGKITPKGETEPLHYDPSRRALAIPLAAPHGPAAHIEIILPPGVSPPS